MAKRADLTKTEQRELDKLKARLVKQQKDVEDGEAAQQRRRDARGATLERLVELGLERQEISDLSKTGGLEGLAVVGVDAARKQYRRRLEMAAADNGEGAKEG